MIKPLAGLLRTADLPALLMKAPKKPRRPKMDLGREKVFRSDAYLVLVRRLPCGVCDQKGSTQAAHSNQLRFGKGKSIKASDAATFPLCGPGGLNCHADHDQGGYISKQKWKSLEFKWICAAIRKFIRNGWLVWDLEPDDLEHQDQSEDAMAMYLVRKIEAGQLKVVL